MHILYCDLDANKYNRIYECESAKVIWDKLVVTYEGMSQVRKTKNNMFVNQYELLKMQPDETIKEMFTRFINIIVDVKRSRKHTVSMCCINRRIRVVPARIVESNLST